MVNEAFLKTAGFHWSPVVIYLHDTGLITSDVFDKAFIMAVSATWTTTKTVEYFCHLKRASAEARSKAFVTAHCPERVKILLENERISDASIIDAFTLSGYAHRYLSKHYLSRSIDFVKLLGKNACIPPKLLVRCL